MDPGTFTRECGEWLRADAPGRPIVISSRARLARNFAGHRFTGRADADERRAIVERARRALAATDTGRTLQWIDFEGEAHRHARLYLERHLVSRELVDGQGPRGVAVSPDERLAVMVVEEDHLRIQAIGAGLAIEETLARAAALDDELARHVDYAFDARLGYLTACPTNVGTGLRVSVLMHLPALAMSGHFKRAFNAVKELRLAVRGLFGEGTETTGDLFQVSNQRTCGQDEETLAGDLGAVVDRLIDYEREARARLRRRDADALEDRVHRAWALLRHARKMSTEEMLRHLSSVRLGCALGLLPPVADATLDRVFLHGQPAHLQRGRAADRTLKPDERDRVRADWIRATLAAPAPGGDADGRHDA